MLEQIDFGLPFLSLISALILTLLVLYDSKEYIEKQMPRISEKQSYVAGLIAAIITVIAVFLHEVAHAVVAIALGLKVIDIGLVPLGGYTIVEPSIIYIEPWKEMAISVAGPLMNLLIAGIALILVKRWSETVPENTAQYIAHINIKLWRLNLLPIFLILDGGKVAHGFFRWILGGLIGDSGPLTIGVMVLSLLTTIVYIIYWFTYGKDRRHFEDIIVKW